MTDIVFDITDLSDQPGGSGLPTTVTVSVGASGGGSGVQSITAGTNVTVDATDPQHPIVSATPGAGGVSSVNGHTGAVTLAASDVGAATSAQGTKADTAVQPGSLAAVATSGAYSDVTGTPTLGTSAALDVPAVGNASSAQVVKGTDTRLADARTPTTHTHAESDVTNLTTDLAAKLAKASNLSDLASAGTARTNLGLGGAATLNVGTATGTVAAGDDSRITGAAQKASNLSDLANASTARTNLGLGTAAVANKVAAGSAGVLDATDATTTNARTPTAHASSHAAAGSDPLSLDDSQVAPVAPNAQTGTTYTFVLADKHRLVTGSNAAAQTYTVPANTSVAYSVGTALQVVQYGAGQITLVGNSSPAVTLRQAHGLKTSAQYAVVTLLKIGTDEWLVTGDTSV